MSECVSERVHERVSEWLVCVISLSSPPPIIPFSPPLIFFICMQVVDIYPVPPTLHPEIITCFYNIYWPIAINIFSWNR